MHHYRKSVATILALILWGLVGLVVPHRATAQTRAPDDPKGIYGPCTSTSYPMQKKNHVIEAGKSLDHVTAITVIECRGWDGPGGTRVVDCPTGSPYTYCVRNQNDGEGNHIYLGVVETPDGSTPRLQDPSDPDAAYGPCNGAGAGAAYKESRVIDAGKDMAAIQDIDVIECSPANGATGTRVVDCPTGSRYTYCLRSDNDGVGNSVYLGVVEGTGGGGTSATQRTTVNVTGGVLAIDLERDSVVFPDVAPGATTQAEIGRITYTNTLGSGAAWSSTVAATSLVNAGSVLPFGDLTFAPGATITPPGLTPGTGGTFSGPDTTPGTSFSDPLTVMTGPGTAQGTFEHTGSTASLHVRSGATAGTYSGVLQYTVTG